MYLNKKLFQGCARMTTFYFLVNIKSTLQIKSSVLVLHCSNPTIHYLCLPNMSTYLFNKNEQNPYQQPPINLSPCTSRSSLNLLNSKNLQGRQPVLPYCLHWFAKTPPSGSDRHSTRNNRKESTIPWMAKKLWSHY